MGMGVKLNASSMSRAHPELDDDRQSVLAADGCGEAAENHRIGSPEVCSESEKQKIKRAGNVVTMCGIDVPDPWAQARSRQCRKVGRHQYVVLVVDGYPGLESR